MLFLSWDLNFEKRREVYWLVLIQNKCSMKKIIFMLVALFCSSLFVNAQRPQPRRERMNPEQMAEMRTQRMVEKYGLDDEQKARLLELNKKQMENRRQVRPKALPKDSLKAMTKEEKKAYKQEREEQKKAMQETMKKNAEDYQAELKKILTSEQYASYQKDEQARMERRQSRRGSMDRRPSL